MGQTASSTAEDTTLRLMIVIDKADAKKALQEAEAIDQYQHYCAQNRVNALARSSLAYEANRLSYMEWKQLEVFLEHAPTFLPARLLRELGDVRLLPLMPSADGGMPHTRPRALLCFPNLVHITKPVTLIHELWHIHQRIHRDWWTAVFHEWGWDPLTDEEVHRRLPERLRTNTRMNPDTIDSPWWMYRRRWVPLPVFTHLAKPSMTETELWWYDLQEGHHIRTAPPELIKEFSRLGVSALGTSALEHPRELAAYLLSEPDRYRGLSGWEQLIALVGHTSVSGGYK